MKTDIHTYRDKVRACWLGKNIGGTLGAPFEGTRGVFPISYYTHDLSKGVLPNDDLDLQLVWLMAAESCGAKLNSEVLGEYWLSFVCADWSEYGAAKGNMRFGLTPPVSGRYKNPYANSDGCFIRSEIWACLMPGHPELAVKYAFEDAIVDHSDEGVYSEMFCAAVESAAFAESDAFRLIDIGLSYIPEDCMVARCVNLAVFCFKNGESWQTARRKIMQLAPSQFGLAKGYVNTEPEPDIPRGELGFDAPCNIGLLVVGLLYGKGDFSESICIAASCGEDADCTAGTLGSILGIIGGTGCIDEKWLTPIGDEIKTVSIDMTKGYELWLRPATTVTELTGRVVNLMPSFMLENYGFDPDGNLYIDLSDNLFDSEERISHLEFAPRRNRYLLSPLVVRRENPLMEAGLAFDDISVNEGAEKTLTLKIRNRFPLRQWLNLKWHMPDDWQITSGRESSMPVSHMDAGGILCEKSFKLIPGRLDRGKYELLLEIGCEGRMSKLFIPFIFVNEG